MKYNKNPRFWSMDLDENNIKDLNKWIDKNKLYGLVDEKEGGIGYINPLFIRKILIKLNNLK